MHEIESIKLCLRKVLEKFDWRPIDEWKDYDFNLLKEDIYASSGVYISTDTLKRLFGKIKYKSDYSPQHATKDALAVYIGYESWEKFLKQERIEPEESGAKKISLVSVFPEKRNSGRKKNYIIVLTAFILILVAVALLRTKLSNPVASFKAINKEGFVPHTVTFEYDISQVRSKDVVVDFDFIHPFQASEYPIEADQQLNLINHTYQVPYVYYPKLKVDERVIETDTIIVKSNGWVVFYDQPNEVKYWMNNMYQNPVYNGYMSFSRKDIAGFKRDTLGIYYTTHRNIMNFGLPGDNFKFEMKFKNSQMDGGISCFDSRLSIICEYQNFLIWFVEKNCLQFCRLKYGEELFDGRKNDLSFLSRDLSDWVVMKVEVVDKHFNLFINGEKSYEGDYEQSAGDIYGLQLRFKGSGLVDYMLLTNIENDTIYFDDFIAK